MPSGHVWVVTAPSGLLFLCDAHKHHVPEGRVQCCQDCDCPPETVCVFCKEDKLADTADATPRIVTAGLPEKDGRRD
jgi:hypothetical protein